MPTERTYLDHNATSPLRPEATAACVAAFAAANPSSLHAEGRRGRAIVETARAEVAALLGAAPDAVILTSGGSEANGQALRPGALLARDGRPVQRLLVGASEHPSVLTGHGFGPDAVELLPVDGAGLVDPVEVTRRLAASDRATLVSIQAANSETGVLQPLAGLSAAVRVAGAALHVDGVQAAGRLPAESYAPFADSLSLSAHKLGGPMGAGALMIAEARRGPALSLIRGGGQERGARAGTEAVPALAGFGAAAAAARRDLAAGEPDRLAVLRDAARAAVRSGASDAVVFGETTPRLPNTLAFAVPGLKAETMLMALDLAGIAVSSGSACSSGRVGRSHVLAAMGVPPDLASGAIRLSLGWSSSAAEIDRFADAFASVLHRLYETRRARAA